MPFSEFFGVGVDQNKVLSQRGVPDYTGVQLHTSAQSIPIPIMWGTRRVAPNVLWQSADLDTNAAFAGPTVGANVDVDGPDVGGNGYTFGGHWLTSLGSPVIPGPFLAAVNIHGGAHAGVYGNNDPYNPLSRWHVPMLLGLCEGPVDSITRVWNGGGSAPVAFSATYNDKLNPPSLFYTLFTGSSTQTAWGYFAAADAQVGGPYFPGQDLAYRNTAYIASNMVDGGHTSTGLKGQSPQQAFEVRRTSGAAHAVVETYPVDRAP